MMDAPPTNKQVSEVQKQMEAEKTKRGKKALPRLPCGCDGSTGQSKGQAAAMMLADGSRVCREHGKRWQLTWVELPPPAGGE